MTRRDHGKRRAARRQPAVPSLAAGADDLRLTIAGGKFVPPLDSLDEQLGLLRARYAEALPRVMAELARLYPPGG